MRAKDFWWLFFLLALSACTHSSSVKNGTPPISQTASPSSAQKRPPGIDFIATGKEPSWSLEVDFGKEMKLYTLAGITTYAPIPAPTSSDQTGLVVYEVPGKEGNLLVTIGATSCPDDSTSEFSLSVEIRQNDKKYVGCGHYLFNAMQLHDIWALEAFKGKGIAQEHFLKGVPTLELFVLSQQFMGHSGCNEVSGRFELKSDKVRFTNIRSTKMACPGDFEASYLSVLQAVNSWRRDNLKLILLKDSEELMVFRKVD